MKAYIAVLLLAVVVSSCGEDNQSAGLPLGPSGAAPSAPVHALGGDSATIATDRADYAPGDTVTITGHGFQAGEIITITLHETPVAHQDRVLSDTADANGDFVNRDFVPEQHHLNVTFHAIAEGSAGSYAETVFTDGARIQSVAVLGVQTPNPVLAGNVASYGSTATNSMRVAFNTSLLGTCTVSLSATGLPTGATANFAPSTLSGTAGQSVWSFLTVSTSLITPGGGTIVFTVRATGTGGTGNSCSSTDTEIAFAALTVQANVATALTLATPNPASVLCGSSSPVTFSATLTRTAGGPAVAGASVSFTVDGVAAGNAVTNSSGVATLASYNPAALAPGNHSIVASFAGGLVGGTTLAASTSAPQTLNVGKATPTITWQNPADIVYGTALSATQLNATANVAGTFIYTPAAGAVLDAGNGQSLFVAFTPADATSYNNATRTVSLNVRTAPLSVVANDKTKIQGGANPALTGGITGIRNGDPITASYSTSATTMSPPGQYPIVPALSDPNGRLRNYAVSIINGTLTVLPNAPPVLGAISAPSSAVPVGSTITAAASFTDADVPESQPYTATIDWGDGSASTSAHAIPGTISGTHAYAASGLYAVTITVRQNNLPTLSDSRRYEYVVVYNADGSFATGGGWLSAPNSVLAVGSRGGRSTFGFVVRYERGASVPSGTLEFQAHDGDINLKSTSFQWLVADAATARFQGVGTVNGRGTYGFQVTAVAGEQGSAKFRIRIWDQATGAPLYDTQDGEVDAAAPTSRVGGGSIRIR